MVLSTGGTVSVSTSFSAMDSLYQSGLAILQNAKTQDGGIVAYLLSHLNLSELALHHQYTMKNGSQRYLNATRTTSQWNHYNTTSSSWSHPSTSHYDPPHENATHTSSFHSSDQLKTLLIFHQVKRTVLQYGFLWAIILALFWIFVLLSCGICLLGLHFRRKQNTKAIIFYKVIAKRLHRNRIRMDKNRVCQGLQCVACILLAIFLFTLLVLTSKTLAEARKSLVTKNQDGIRSAIVPKLSSALRSLSVYFDSFSREALNSTAPIVNELIAATEKLQEESAYQFNDAFQERIGGARSFQLGDKIAYFQVSLLDYTQNLTGGYHQTHYDLMRVLQQTLFPEWKKSLLLEMGRSQLKADPSGQINYLQFKKWSLNRNVLQLKYDFATAYHYFMSKENRTRENILWEANYGKERTKDKMEHLQARVIKALDIPGTLRNATNEVWEQMHETLSVVVGNIEQLQGRLSTNGHDKLLEISFFLVLLVVACLMIIVACLTTAFGIFCRHRLQIFHLSDGTRNALKLWTYPLIVMLTVPVLFSLLLFLTTGYVETDVCRYVRMSDVEAVLSRNETPLLDQKINEFLEENWSIIKLLASNPDSDLPLPRPRSLLTSLVHECRQNAPLLKAIHAIDSIDARKLNKPEITQKFVDVGRELMLETIHSTGPYEFLAPGLLENIQKGDSLDKFISEDIPTDITEADSFQIFRINGIGQADARSVNLLRTLLRDLRRQPYSPSRYLLINHTEALLQHTEKLRNVRLRAISDLTAISQLKPVGASVSELQQLLPQVVAQLADKATLLKMANEMYTELVESTTLDKAASLMGKYGPRMLGAIGHCRPLYDAFSDATYAACISLQYPLTGLWLLLGCGCVLCTMFLLFTLSLLSKNNIIPQPVACIATITPSTGEAFFESDRHGDDKDFRAEDDDCVTSELIKNKKSSVELKSCLLTKLF